MDVLEIDAASNRGIDNIKELRDRIAFAPVDGRYKVYVIDEVHMLTTEAFNALLKTLEEPPDNVVFILATTDPHKVPATIHSRCQRFDFHRVTVDDITQHLVMVAKGSDIVADKEALRLIAIQAEGGMRDALSLLDQCAVMSPRVTVDSVRDTLGIVGREALRELVTAIGNYDAAKTIEITHKLLVQGREAVRILTELTEYLRALLLFKTIPEDEEIYLVDDKEALAANAELFSTQRILSATEQIAKGMNNVKNSLNPRIFLELALLQLCSRDEMPVRVEKQNVQPIEKTVNVPKPKIADTQPTEKKQPVVSAEPVKESIIEKKEQDMAKVPKQSVVVKSDNSAVKQAKKATESQGTVSQNISVGQQYWQMAVEYLAQQGKKAVSSCAKSGKVVEFKDNKMTVLFAGNDFICKRMSNDDYKSAMENTILTMQRVGVKCQFVSQFADQTNSAAVTLAKDNKTEEKLPPSVEEAWNAFGGTIKKEE